MGVLNFTITALKIKNDDVFYVPETAKISREDIVKGLMAIFLVWSSTKNSLTKILSYLFQFYFVHLF